MHRFTWVQPFMWHKMVYRRIHCCAMRFLVLDSFHIGHRTPHIQRLKCVFFWLSLLAQDFWRLWSEPWSISSDLHFRNWFYLVLNFLSFHRGPWINLEWALGWNRNCVQNPFFYKMQNNFPNNQQNVKTPHRMLWHTWDFLFVVSRNTFSYWHWFQSSAEPTCVRCLSVCVCVAKRKYISNRFQITWHIRRFLLSSHSQSDPHRLLIKYSPQTNK